jgi:hypothetical protein
MSRRVRRQRRTDSALEHRKWVTDYRKPEAIADELVSRVKVLDDLIAPYLLSLRGAFEEFSETVLAEADAERTRRSLPLVAAKIFGRTLVAGLIALYWRENPYRRGRYLPRIAHRGNPWEPLPPDAIHVLDLPKERLRAAWRRGEKGRLETLIDGRMDFITMWEVQGVVNAQLDGAWAWRNLFFIEGAFYLHYTAAYHADKRLRRRAADALDRILYELLPRLSRYRVRTAGGLERTREVYGQAVDLLKRLNEAPTASKLLREATSFDRHITRARLERYRGGDVRRLARKLTAKRLGLSLRTVRSHSDIFDLAEDIQEVWAEVTDYLRDCPQHPLNSLLPVPPSVAPPPPSPSA